jgi:hypothetical protein
MGDIRNAYKILVGKPERKNSKYLGVDGRIILKWISEKQRLWVWIGFISQDRDRQRALVNTTMNLRVP